MRLPLSYRIFAALESLRRLVDRAELWVLDHGDTADWPGEEVTIEPAPRTVVHHIPAGISYAEIERAYEMAARSARCNHRS